MDYVMSAKAKLSQVDTHDTTLVNSLRGRVLVLVDQVLVEVLHHELLALLGHPSMYKAEGGQHV